MGKLKAFCLGAIGLFGCSTVKVPTERFSGAEAAVRAAQEGGADKVPAASFYLQLAQDEIAEAKRLVGDGKNELAYNMLVRAGSDADLALGVAREVTARAKAQEAVSRVQQMRSGSRSAGDH